MLFRSDDSNNIGIIALSIAKHRLGMSRDAIKELNKLTTYFNNPYILELKGQIYYESGEARKAFNIFTKLDKLLPDQPLIKIEYASVILSLNNKKFFPLAIEQLNTALLTEQDNIHAWKILAELYSKTDNLGLMNLSLAEVNLLLEKYKLAIQYAKKAKQILEEENNLKNITRVSDIIIFAKDNLK